MLYTTPVDDSMKALPSPEILQKKIIIKAKKLSGQIDGESEANESSDDDEEKNESDFDDSDDSPNQVKSIDKDISASNLAEDLDLVKSAHKTAHLWRSPDECDSLANEVALGERSTDCATENKAILKYQEKGNQGKSESSDTPKPSDQISVEVTESVSCY
jgi:hypothetical protein